MLLMFVFNVTMVARRRLSGAIKKKINSMRNANMSCSEMDRQLNANHIRLMLVKKQSLMNTKLDVHY